MKPRFDDDGDDSAPPVKKPIGPPKDWAFDENGDPVPITQFLFPEAAQETAETRAAQQDSILGLLRLLCDAGGPKEVGAYAMLLLFTINRGDFKDRAALAKKMGVTRARVCQHLTLIRKKFPGIARNL